MFKRVIPSSPAYRVPALNVLDIGTTKYMCVQGYHFSNSFRITGIGYHSAAGISGGQIIDTQLCADHIVQAIETAEGQSGELIKDVTVGLSGKAITNKVIKISTHIGGKLIDDNHVSRLFQELLKFSKEKGKHILYCTPQTYMIDGAMGVLDPRGIAAHELSGSFFVTFGDITFIDNIMNVLDKCHLSPLRLISSGYAASEAVLLEDERTLGSVSIDIGGKETQVIVMSEGYVTQSFALPIGSSHITHDLAKGLGVGLGDAERLKTLYGSSIIERGDEQKLLQIKDLNINGSKQITQYLLTSVIRARVEELFELVTQQLKIKSLARGQKYILTGGGSLLPGIKEKAELMLKGTVRIGTPFGLNAQDGALAGPEFSACVGLLSLASKENYEIEPSQKKKYFFWDKIKSWIYDTV